MKESITFMFSVIYLFPPNTSAPQPLGIKHPIGLIPIMLKGEYKEYYNNVF